MPCDVARCVVLTLSEALAALPKTADGIATFLAERGIKGVRKDDCICPIAQYLTGFGSWEWSPEVGCNYIAAEDDDGEGFRESTPEHVTEFIVRFDGGAWPDLVAEVAGDAPG